VETAGHENVKMNENMSNHTSFRIGGPADYFVTPSSVEELQNVISQCQRENVPYYIIGNGSNLLVGDQGFRGVMIQIVKYFNQIELVENGQVKAGAGMMLSRLAVQVAEHNLTGLEFEAGIPGTLGGAVTMNAGAYGGEIKDFLVSVEVLDNQGKVFTLQKEELELGYRTSILQKKSYVVLSALFFLPQGNKEESLKKIMELNFRRKEKQPLEYPSAGSTFKRPEGYFAGKLIMDSGLTGYRVGDIMVSEKHCGFVINAGNGTAKDVRTLIQDVQNTVFEKFGVKLETEVKFLGEF
jgi:UDP-N-acetylenolpyruvoylglucosamine reductase